MIFQPSATRVYIALGATDMRKSINGLSLLVEDQFAFCNRKRDLVKILYWQENGFCVWLKRLEEDIFRWPESEKEVLEVNQVALEWLLHGLDLNQAHQRLSYSSVS